MPRDIQCISTDPACLNVFPQCSLPRESCQRPKACNMHSYRFYHADGVAFRLRDKGLCVLFRLEYLCLVSLTAVVHLLPKLYPCRLYAESHVGMQLRSKLADKGIQEEYAAYEQFFPFLFLSPATASIPLISFFSPFLARSACHKFCRSLLDIFEVGCAAARRFAECGPAFFLVFHVLYCW